MSEEPDDQVAKPTELSAAMQSHIVAMALRHPGFMARVRPVMNPDYFKDDALSDIVAWSNQHWDSNKEVPSRQSLKDCFPDQLALIKSLWNQELTDPKHTTERLCEWARLSACRIAVFKGGAVIASEMKGEEYRNEKGKVEKVDLVKLMRDAIMVGSDMSNVGVDFHAAMAKDIGEILCPPPEELLPTGLGHLDEAGVSIERGELGCVLGPSKRGKSHVLINLAYGAMKHGLNVIYYTLEMSDKKIRRRFHLRIAGKNADIRADPQNFVEVLKERAAKYAKGKLLVKRYPSRGATVDDIRAHLTMAVSQGFKPDVVIVDYAGILRAVVPSGETRLDIAEIFVQLRAIAGEYNVGLWTGAQTNRGGANKEVVDQTDLAECYDIMSHLDAGFSISMTLDEKERGEGRFVIFAARNAPDGTIVTFNHDYSRSLITTTGLQRPVAEKKRRDKESSGPMANAEAAIGNAKLRGKKPDTRDNI